MVCYMFVNPATLPRTSVSLCLPRAEEHQKETDDFGVSTQCEENKQQHRCKFILPFPYLSGNRRPHVVKPARLLNPVMEKEMELNEEEAERQRHLVSMTAFEAKVDLLFSTLTQLFQQNTIV